MAENKFRDRILKDLGEIAFSDTQKLRVLRVRDEMTEDIKVSVSKWWRPDNNAEWIAGKGFKVTYLEAHELAEILSQA